MLVRQFVRQPHGGGAARSTDATRRGAEARRVALLKAGSTRVYKDRSTEDVLEFATGPGFFKVEQDRALALVDDAVDSRHIDHDRAQEQLEEAQAELEKVERGESDADRWQLEQRVRHAENQLGVAGRT